MAHSLILTPNTPTGAVSQQLIGSFDGTGIWLADGADSLSLPPPSYDEAYAESSDTEGGKRSRSKPQNVKGGLKVYIGGHDAATYNLNVGNWQKTIEAVRRWGGTLVYTPDGGTAVTYNLESAWVSEMPQDGVLVQNRLCESAMEFVALPYGELATITNATLSDIDTFWRDSITNQEWRFDAGGGTLSVSGGLLVPSSTAEKRLIRALNVIDVSQAVVKVTTGASVASGDTGITLKRLDASNEIRCRVEFAGASSLLRIAKFDATVASNLAASSAFTPTAATSYWLQTVMAGNVITVNIYSSDPNGASPTAALKTLAFTLTAGDATKFGSGVKGSPGLRFNPQATDYRWDDFRVDSGAIEGFDPVLNFELASVPGSAPALAKLRLTDASAQARSYAEWGLDDRYYEKTAPQPTLLDSDILSVSGLAGAGNTRTGAYDPGAAGNNVIRATLTTTPVAVCSTGTQSHTGPLKIKARMWGNGTGPIYVRLAYRVADAPWSRMGWVRLLGLSAFYEQLLGTIRIPKTLLGSQSWEGRIEAYTSTPGDTLDIDFVKVLPAKRYGKARAPFSFETPTTFSARSEFDTESGAITGDALAQGGNWTAVTNSDTDDFSASAGVATRTAVSDSGTGIDLLVGRGVTAGTTSYTNIAASLDASASVATASIFQSLLLRVTDSSNYLGAYLRWNGALSAIVAVDRVIAGVGTIIFTTSPFALTAGLIYTLKVVTLANGYCIVYFGPQGSQLTLIGSFFDSNLATGGTLATGKIGIADRNATAIACTRTYDNFAAWVPETNLVIPSSGNLEIRHNAAIRSTGARLSPEGAYLKVDPSGRDGRGAQLGVAAYRSDTDTLPDDQIADAIKAEVDLTPRVVLLDG